MNKYLLYSYLEAIEFRLHDYSKEYKFDNNDFDLGKVKAFNNAITIIKELLSGNSLLEEYITDDKCIDNVSVYEKNDISKKHLIKIIKQYIVAIQKLYNNLFEKKDLLAAGEKFGYYDVLDMLEIDIKSSIYKNLFKSFNILIPASLDKKVQISKL